MGDIKSFSKGSYNLIHNRCEEKTYGRNGSTEEGYIEMREGVPTVWIQGTIQLISE